MTVIDDYERHHVNEGVQIFASELGLLVEELGSERALRAALLHVIRAVMEDMY